MTYVSCELTITHFFGDFNRFYLFLYYQKTIDFSRLIVHNKYSELNAILERGLIVNFVSFSGGSLGVFRKRYCENLGVFNVFL